MADDAAQTDDADQAGGAEPRSRWRKAWPHIRTALILYHAAAVLTFCVPGTGRVLKKSAWKTPVSQQSFRNWSARLNAIGFDTTPESFEKGLWKWTQRYAAAHRKALTPFKRYANRLHLYQGWALFSSPQIEPAELHIDVSIDGAYQTIYVSRSDEHTWRRSLFDSNRMRKLVGRVVRRKNLGRYPALVAWIAREVAVDFPRAKWLRVRLKRYRSTAPGAAQIRTHERFTDERVVELAPLRKRAKP